MKDYIYDKSTFWVKNAKWNTLIKIFVNGHKELLKKSFNNTNIQQNTRLSQVKKNIYVYIYNMLLIYMRNEINYIIHIGES